MWRHWNARRPRSGCRRALAVDNGPEFVSKDLDLWAFMRGGTLDFSRPGKPTDNAGPGRLGNSGFISVFRGADQREDGQMKQARFTQDYLLWSRV